MRRRLVTFSSALSLLLCLAVCGLWVRSYWVTDEVGWGRTAGQQTNRSVYGAASGWGRVVVTAMVDMPPGVSLEPAGPFYYSRPPGRPARMRARLSWPNQMGFFLMSQRPEWGIILPHWFLGLLLAVLPTLYVLSAFRRRRAGRCPSCGYDLRATPDRCPECGRSAEAS